MGILVLSSLVGCGESHQVSVADGGQSQTQAITNAGYATSETVAGTDWKQFRGPDSTSVAFSSGFPTEWDEKTLFGNLN